MNATLTYVGDHRLVSTAMFSLVRLSLADNLQIRYETNPRLLDLDNSALEVTVESLQDEDWNFQQDLALFLEALDHPDWKLVTLRHSMLYTVIQVEDDGALSRVITDHLTSIRR